MPAQIVEKTASFTHIDSALPVPFVWKHARLLRRCSHVTAGRKRTLSKIESLAHIALAQWEHDRKMERRKIQVKKNQKESCNRKLVVEKQKVHHHLTDENETPINYGKCFFGASLLSYVPSKNNLF